MGILKSFLDLLYPPKCVFCEKILDDSEDGLCISCRDALPETHGTQAKTNGNFFEFCVSPFYYEGPVRDSILRFKFGGRSGYASVYAKYLARCVSENIPDGFDLITWVPVSAKRLRKRGYDQARLLCENTAKVLDKSAVQVLRKVRDNVPQSSLDGVEKRRANVIGAYEITDRQAVEGKTVLLVDDICTTGATLSECAKTLLLAGAETVFCAAIAKTRDSDI